jgi:ATP-dependent DNA helicase PIF1
MKIASMCVMGLCRMHNVYLNSMDQTLALEIMLAGHSVMLTGPAGSGKTHVLNEFIRHAKKDGKTLAVTATTGLAATHLGGNTIHSWSGIGIHDKLHEYFFNDMKQGRIDTINKTNVLIIDEVSMLHDYRLDMVDQIARQVRGEDVPFGGIQLIMCGDFFQLPPISREEARQGSFVINSEVWQEIDPVICYLDEQHRQDDTDYLEILTALRSSDLRRRHLEMLMTRQNQPIGEATELHTTNVDVDSINDAKLAELPGEEHKYKMVTTGGANYVDSLKKSCLASDDLVLKKGALVMCIKNSPERKYVNGSLGIVEDFEPLTDYPIVRLKNGRVLTITPETWELRDGDKKRASLSQLPLRLAWAITVHKSQGMTLDGARIDLRKAFVEGMGYVALSRVKNLDSLSLVGINNMALKVSPEALSIDENLRAKSAKHAKQHEALRENAKTRKKIKTEAKKPKGDWNVKISKMRETYPNAFRPWAPDDDEKLVKLFSKGKEVKVADLTKIFGRHPGSIRARLKKHFGEDAIL